MLLRRMDEREKAASLAATRLDLWQHWAHKLPNNPFVQRQLEAHIP
jgi:hypothetical protein